jgi:hypothetical protein
MKPVADYSVRVTPNEGPTFNYLFWEENVLKIKYSEKHYRFEVDYDTSRVEKTPINVHIIMLIDTQDGFVQLRLDTPGMKHTHRNDEGKSTDSTYETYYKNLLHQIFPDLQFNNVNLNKVIRTIRLKREIPYLIHRDVITITGDAKLMRSWRTKTDIRDLPEYKQTALMKEAEDWLIEDLTGYWTATGANGQLNNDLYMKILRKESELRVQRGSLAKELNYGIGKIREIQNEV